MAQEGGGSGEKDTLPQSSQEPSAFANILQIYEPRYFYCAFNGINYMYSMQERNISVALMKITLEDLDPPVAIVSS